MSTVTKTRKRRPKRRSEQRSKYAHLHGILPDPPKVAQMVDASLVYRPATPEARRRVIEHWKLDYYFCGLMVAYIERRKGREIVAVDDEIPGRINELSPRVRKRVIYACTRPWMEEIEEP